MRLHSILIPHRNRHERLGHCLRSIARSAWITGGIDYEVVVIDLNSIEHPWGQIANGIWWTNVTLQRYYTADKGFNKCHALNHGLQVARGSTISFLDADAIVGPRWLEGVRHLDRDASLVRLCYRVRMINQDQSRQLTEAAAKGQEHWEAHVDKAFRKFNLRYADEGGLQPGFEAYYQPNHNWFRDPKGRRPLPDSYGPHVFGNSQFSMRREDLGDLRFDEEGFPHAGSEDLDFIEQIRRKFGQRYRARILTDPDHAMIHIQSPGEDDWQQPGWAEEQRKHYLKKWYPKSKAGGSSRS